MPRPVLEDTMNSSAMFEQCSSTVIDVLNRVYFMVSQPRWGNGSESRTPRVSWGPALAFRSTDGPEFCILWFSFPA